MWRGMDSYIIALLYRTPWTRCPDDTPACQALVYRTPLHQIALSLNRPSANQTSLLRAKPLDLFLQGNDTFVANLWKRATYKLITDLRLEGGATVQDDFACNNVGLVLNGAVFNSRLIMTM